MIFTKLKDKRYPWERLILKGIYENIFTIFSHLFFYNHWNNIVFNYIIYMSRKFENISTKPGFMKHNGGLTFRTISKNKYQFKTKVKKIHLNRAGITHGGFLAGIIDAGSGTAVHRAAENKQVCVTISLDIKFIGSSKIGETIIGDVEIQKVTNSLIFMRCKLSSNKKILATGSGVWKKTKRLFIT